MSSSFPKYTTFILFEVELPFSEMKMYSYAYGKIYVKKNKEYHTITFPIHSENAPSVVVAFSRHVL